jgi:hypothetical protein
MQADKVRPAFIQFGRQVNQPEPVAGNAFGAEDVSGVEVTLPIELDLQIDLAERRVEF